MRLGSWLTYKSDLPDRCAWWHVGWGICPGADAHSPAHSLGKVLMILITGLVCAINIYFVVDFLPTLQGLGYYIPLGLLLAAYVAFVTYLVRLALWEGMVGGDGVPAGCPSTCPLCPHRSGRAALRMEPSSWPGATTADSALASRSTRRPWQGPDDKPRPPLLSPHLCPAQPPPPRAPV